MQGLVVRLRAAVGLSVAQLRHYRVRTGLAVLAIALAVLSTTLLASVGYGVLETGQAKFESSQQDLWVTGGPVRFAPGTVGGVENTLVDSHAVAADIRTHADVRIAAPMAFQTVYVGTDPSDLETVVGVGVPNVGERVIDLDEGPGFEEPDVHYANGSYDGPMTRSIIVDRRTATRFDLAVGDRVHVGGTISSARDQQFTVVGISPTFSEFLGTPSVVLHLSELQEITGTTGTDPASMITITLAPGAEPNVVARDLERQYPEYRVRTNREQLRALLQEQTVVIASAGTLVVLALLTGIALTANVLALIVYQQRTELAALKAGGVSSRTLVIVIGCQAILLGVVGGGLGVIGTPPLAAVVDVIAGRVVGFENLVRTPDWALPVGFGIAVGIGVIGAIVAGWRVVRIQPLEHLRW